MGSLPISFGDKSTHNVNIKLLLNQPLRALHCRQPYLSDASFKYEYTVLERFAYGFPRLF